MSFKKKSVTIAPAVLLVLLGCEPAPPDIPFASYGDDYASKTDFARVEQEMPLTREDLAKITPVNLEALTQEQLDQLYARLPSGPIPHGAYDGTFFFADGGGARRLAEIVGGLEGIVIDKKLDVVNRLGERLWKGKVFDRETRVLRNMIRDRWILEKVLHTELDSAEKVVVEGKRSWLFFPMKAWLLFPAKLYCGQSRLDGRRESVVIDYAFNDDLEGYRPDVDYLVARQGLYIRDEIRMIRPGFYLGRAYFAHVFGLNFALYNDEVANAGYESFMAGEAQEQDCWPGTQAPTLSAATS